MQINNFSAYKGGSKTRRFYFEDNANAQIARFFVYSCFDYERLTISGFQPPVSMPRKIMIREKDLNKIKILSSYEDLTLEDDTSPNNETSLSNNHSEAEKGS